MKKKGTKSRRVDEAYFGASFDARRAKEEDGDTSALLQNRVSLSVPAGSTHFDFLTLIAQKSVKPILVRSLSEELKKLKPPRGGTFFGEIAVEIDAIVNNYPTLRWWMTEQGLVVDTVSPELTLSRHSTGSSGHYRLSLCRTESSLQMQCV
jgi:hypothetical protein